jgi:ribulose kinase
MGAAICAAVGSGMHPSWDVAVSRMVRLTQSVSPSPGGSHEYERFHRVHTELRARTHDLFEWMTASLDS